MNGNGHHDPPSVEETGENKLNGNLHEQPPAAPNVDGQSAPGLPPGLPLDDMHRTASQGTASRETAKSGGRRSSLGRQQSARSAVSARSAGSAGSRRRRRHGTQESVIMWPDPNIYNHRSFFLFRLDGIVRKAAIACIEWKWWDRIVLFLIFLNTIQLAVYNPFDVPQLNPVSPFRDALDIIGKVFSILFALECFVKCIALGLIVGEKTYLRDAWNYLDMFIVIIGMLDFIPSGGGETGNLSALRSLRVMRPLRAVTKFPELRFLVVLLLQCIPMLSNVLGLCCFIFFVFGILGVQLYAGVLRGLCFHVDDGMVGDATPAPCTLGGGTSECPVNYECLLLGENDSRGVVSFDSIGAAIMTIFQVMTMEGWNDVMYLIQDTYSPAMFVYFVLLIFLGPIFAIQLFLVVISTKFAETKESLKALEAGQIAEVAVMGDDQELGEGFDHARRHSMGGVGQDNQVYPDPGGVGGGEPVGGGRVPEPFPISDTNGRSGDTASIKDLGVEQSKESAPAENSGEGDHHDAGNGDTGEKKEEPASADRPDPRIESPLGTVDGNGSMLSALGGMKKGEKGRKRRRKLWKRVLIKVEEVAKSEFLSNFIMGMIVLNTMLMGIDHNCNLCEQGYCARYKAFLEGTNLAFAGIFLAEMLIKIVGLGPYAYFTNKMNLFDGIIVVVSLLEVEAVFSTSECLWNTPTPYTPAPCDDFTPCSGGGGGVTVLRTFRLVRIVKLLRAFPDIQKQIRIVISILGSVAALIALIAIFLLIFCILGMNVFGGTVIEEWDPELISRGASVYVSFPSDDLVGLYGRHGEVIDVDPFNHTMTPWKVRIDWGTAKEVYEPLGINPEGWLWVADQDTSSIGAPAITGVVPRFHYDDLFHASITTFQILTTANWNDVEYNHIAGAGSAAAIYFYAIIVIGNWMLLNLFIAILIQGFAEQKASQLAENLLKVQEQFVEKLGHLDETNFAQKMQELFEQMDEDHSGWIEKRELQNVLESLGVFLRAKELTDMFRKYDQDGGGTINFTEFLTLIKDMLGEAKSQLLDGTQGKQAVEEAKELHESREKEMLDDGTIPTIDHEKTFWCIGIHNPFRQLCVKISENKVFDNIVLAAILISSVTLAMESPTIGDNSPVRQFLTIMDLVLNGIFTFECFVKVIAQSFKIYRRSGWNRLDLLIVSTSVLDMVLTYGLEGNIDLAMLKIFRTFRILRALRPLRIIARARGLRILVSTIMSAVKPVLNTVSIALGVFAIFGILGMQILMGKMYSCADVQIVNQGDCDPRDWQNYPVNFDNLYYAVRSMFILATQDDWPDHMFAGVDATTTTTGPYQNNNPFLALYYIASILIAGYLVINIFVGVFVDCYNSAATELEVAKVEKITANKLPPIFDDPESPSRLQVLSVVTTTAFDMFIAFFIVTNVISMAFESFKQSAFQNDFAVVTNFFFSFLFGWECVFKIYAFYPRRYYVNGWNKFDFFIVMISYLGIAVDNLGTSVGVNPTVLRVLRVFRIFRILRAFRIFKAAKGLQAIIATLGNSLPALMNLFSMLGLVFFIFAVLGITLFGGICTDGDQSKPGLQAVPCLFTDPDLMFHRHAHFKGIGVALLSLFRVATGDAWGEMLDTSQTSPGSRKLEDSAWESFMGLWDTVPPGEWQQFASHYEQVLGEAPVIDREASGMPLLAATIAIWRWNSTTFGLEEDPAWPLPDAAPLGGEWVALANSALPNCIEEGEIVHLEKLGLADCSVGGYDKACITTCGSGIGGFLYFSTFVCLAAFVLLQLVIAVLMEQLSANEDELAAGSELMPGASTLKRLVFDRMYRRWRWNAARKLRFERKAARRTASGATQPETERKHAEANRAVAPSAKVAEDHGAAKAVESQECSTGKAAEVNGKENGPTKNHVNGNGVSTAEEEGKGVPANKAEGEANGTGDHVEGNGISARSEGPPSEDTGKDPPTGGEAGPTAAASDVEPGPSEPAAAQPSPATGEVAGLSPTGKLPEPHLP